MDFKRDPSSRTKEVGDLVGVVVGKGQGGQIQLGDLRAVHPRRDDWLGTDDSNAEFVPVRGPPRGQEFMKSRAVIQELRLARERLDRGIRFVLLKGVEMSKLIKGGIEGERDGMKATDTVTVKATDRS